MSRIAGWFSRKGLQVQFIALTMCTIVGVMSLLGYLAVHPGSPDAEAPLPRPADSPTGRSEP